ncbi:MAG TPA: hypothetical protein VKE40_11005 [Gemmataceae bacterium]|nr:hypothetical protein [Gemmataceae bacterium]
MLKELNRLWYTARRQAAAWRRWNAKLPHNRVWRQRIRDAGGRPIGYGPPMPMPEPALPPPFCQVTVLPAGRRAVVLTGAEIESAYRHARRPRPTAGDVESLAIPEARIRELFVEYCQK